MEIKGQLDATEWFLLQKLTFSAFMNSDPWQTHAQILLKSCIEDNVHICRDIAMSHFAV
jgi:hypothetical protein